MRAHPRRGARPRDAARSLWPVRAVIATAALLVLALTLSACGGSTPGSASRSGTGNSLAGKGSATGLTLWAPADRARLPKLVGRTLDSERLNVNQWRGHVVVVNTWGSWCGPCRDEAPGLARVANETAPSGVRFVGIDTRDNDASARAFVREFAIPYPSIVDDEGRVMLALASTVPVSAVPSTVVVDAKGRIAARVVGAVTYPTLRGLVDDVLAEKTLMPSGAAKAGSR